jgi:hypothetical protein
MSFDSLSVGLSGISRFSGQRGRTGEGTNRAGVRYPSPFFDIAHTYLPPSMKHMMRWCRYYYLVNPLINSVIHKMSEYPITELVIEEKSPELKNKWGDLLNHQLRYRPFQIECGLDYYTYGICVVTIHFPFTKYLVCKSCKHKHKATKTVYKWKEFNYVFQCDKCNHYGPAIVMDYYERDVRKIRLVRWNPENVYIDPKFPGSDPTYTFELPLQLKNDLIVGTKSLLDVIPDTFVEAFRRNKFVRFAQDNIFVLRRPTISQKDQGWGMPLIMPVMKDTFYLQILRKAQEMIAQEHIVPLRILFPQAGSSTTDPYTTISLESWKGRIEAELAKWKYDQNYIPILPLPVGNQTIGGDGKALGLYQEMEVWSRHIVAGMGVPEEFIFGGMQYSGSNVSMRMLENSFIGYRTDHEVMLNDFVIRRIAAFMDWPSVRVHMKRFKMADDLQRSAFFFQLNQAQKISNQSLLEEVDFDPIDEEDRMTKELDRQVAFNRKTQLAMAGIQGEASVIQGKYAAQVNEQQMKAQADAQAAMGPPGGDQIGGVGQDGAIQGQDPNGGQQQPGQAQQAGGGANGPNGEMMPGPQVDPSMPEGSTVSSENGQQAPTEGIPQEMQSPLTMGQKGGGFNLLYLARRAATAIQKKDPASQFRDLENMKMTNPQLYSLVLQMVQKSQGSQANPLDPIQSPQPELKPTRRKSSTGV